MKRLVSTSFRRRVLFCSLSIGISIVLVIGYFFYHHEKHKLIQEYASDLSSHIPAITNELLSSNQLAPLEAWPVIYPADSTHFSMFICNDNNDELWRSMDEQSRKKLLEHGITVPDIENYCLDPLLPTQIDSFRLIQTESGSAFIAHVLPMDATQYNPQGRIVILRRVEDKIGPLNELKTHVSIVTAIVATLIALIIHFVYRWGFQPFRKLEDELNLIRSGKKTKLTETYPDDLAPLTNALNEMLFQQTENEQRYRKGLNDLAHSLKTRVAVSQALLSDTKAGSIDTINQQLLEMDDVIKGQLKRASFGVRGITENSTPIKPILTSLLMMFDKVHIDKGLKVELFIADGQTLPMSKSDMMEVLGNILENTYRFAQQRIDIVVNKSDSGILITVDNDGPELDVEARNSVFQRGVRADETSPGTGLGLALCDEIVHSYKGAIWFEEPTDPSMGVSLKILLPYQTSR